MTPPLRVLLAGPAEVAVVDMEMATGSAGPPLHVHPTHGEGFYVLAGLLTVQVDAEIVTAGPGTWLWAPRDTPHTLANLGTDAARVLCVFAPGGFERRFQRILAELDGGTVPAGLVEPSEAERATRIVGPPLA